MTQRQQKRSYVRVGKRKDNQKKRKSHVEECKAKNETKKLNSKSKTVKISQVFIEPPSQGLTKDGTQTRWCNCVKTQQDRTSGCEPYQCQLLHLSAILITSAFPCEILSGSKPEGLVLTSHSPNTGAKTRQPFVSFLCFTVRCSQGEKNAALCRCTHRANMDAAAVDDDVAPLVVRQLHDFTQLLWFCRHCILPEPYRGPKLQISPGAQRTSERSFLLKTLAVHRETAQLSGPYAMFLTQVFTSATTAVAAPYEILERGLRIERCSNFVQDTGHLLCKFASIEAS